MPDELGIHQNPEQNLESPIQNKDKIQGISEFYQNNKATNESIGAPIIEKSPIDYYVEAFRKYSNFSGRATRSEFWYFYLFHFLIILGLGMLVNLIPALSALGQLYLFGSITPAFALIVRRLNDTGKRWVIFIAFNPLMLVLFGAGVITYSVNKSVPNLLMILTSLLGVFLIFIFSVLDSTPGTNKYGPNPNGIES